jgi:penicillin amidase
MMRVPLALLCAIGLWLQANAADSSAGTHRMAVEGLGEPATIVIDRWGIPHIFAASIHDAYFLQGFNAARDRLWQIDLWRKRGLGLLAKSFGPTYIDQDRAARLLLYRGDMDLEWSAYAPGAREATEAFVAGINAYVDKVRGGEIPAPPEFALTASTPERWEAADVVRMAWSTISGRKSREPV